ncbi:MAG: hypothetical protein U0325_28770 [Polyangiales bacterium]
MSQGAAVADALKHFFNPALVAQIADRYAAAWADFPRARFVRDATQGLEDLELLARGAHLADALGACLPPDFLRAADIVEASLGPVHPTTESFGMAPFAYLPEVTWVGARGLAHFDRAMALQHALTKRFSSCEFSVRPTCTGTPSAPRGLSRLGPRPRPPTCVGCPRGHAPAAPVGDVPAEVHQADPSPASRCWRR